MKMIYGGVPVNSLKVRHYEISTNDATLRSSDLQAGVTAYAKGQKVTGTGKAFSFATYGDMPSNISIPIPVSEINTIVLSSVGNSIKMLQDIISLRSVDFSTAQEIATVTINGMDYPIKIQIMNNMFTIICEQMVVLQIMFGKDEYI
jgi:hypothetical protein